MSESQSDIATSRSGDVLAGSNELVELAPGIFGQEQAGWLVTITTQAGLVQIDTGDQAAASMAAIRERLDDPLHAIVFSHGHQRYNLTAREWVLAAVQRDGVVPRVIGHENVARRQRRYRQSQGLQNRIIERQFRYPRGTFDGRTFEFLQPTETFSESLTINTPDRTLDVVWAPSETDDAVAVWMREDRILYGGPSCIPFLPNVGSPQRPVRDPIRWADTLDRLALYPAEMLIREFGPPVEGRDEVQDYLTSTSAALRWLHNTVVDLMNEGHSSHEIVNMVEFPEEIFDRPWLADGYTSRAHVLRDVYRTQFGWWEDQNPTSLNPAHPAEVAQELRAAISDPAAVVAHAASVAERGDVRLALHVVDLIALGDGTDDVTKEARTLKADLCRRAAEVDTSYISQSLYLNGAEELERVNGDGS